MYDAAAQKRYRQTKKGKAANRRHVQAWRERQGDAYRKQQRIRIRAYVRLKNYGITVEEFEAMLVEQGGVCAICGGPPTGKNWNVDHDHVTGVVRAILCSGCNSGLGYFKDDPEMLRAAADYIEKHR